MKKTIVSFVISALVVASLLLWVLNGGISGNFPEIVMMACALLVVGFAVFSSMRKLKSLKRKEPAEDEMSKQVMTRASSLSFYFSIYLWLLFGYLSDKVRIPAHSLIGAGILGMAIIFLLSWFWIRLCGMKNE